MKSFKEISEQHAEGGRFKPVKPHNVASKGLVSPRDKVDSADAKLKEDFDICKFCQHDPCICDDSHGFVTETKRMSAAVKLQRAFEREQQKSQASRARAQELLKPKDTPMKKEETQIQEGVVDTVKRVWKAVSNFDNPSPKYDGQTRRRQEQKKKLQKMKTEGYNDYHNNRTGFAKRHREDDEYHVPDDERQTHTIKMKLSKDGGEVQHKQMNVKTIHGAEHAKQFAHSKAKEQGWTVHEEVEHIEEGKMGEKAAGDLDFNPVAKGEKPPFDGPYSKKPSATPGKYGSGYSTARHLARQAMSKFGKTKLKEEEEFSTKAQIVKKAKKGKKSDDTFQPDPELGSTVVKADN